MRRSERPRDAARRGRAQAQAQRHRTGADVREHARRGGHQAGDIVTSLSGQTVEILNTDAEGRLILADALSLRRALRAPGGGRYRHAHRRRASSPSVTSAPGCSPTRTSLAQELQAAGAESWDRVWQLPLWEDYQEQLKSNFADFANIGGRPAGSVTAACFLSKFTRKYDWAHLDIAGTALEVGQGKRARPAGLFPC